MLNALLQRFSRPRSTKAIKNGTCQPTLISHSNDYCLSEANIGPIVSRLSDAVIGHAIRTKRQFEEAEISNVVRLIEELGRQVTHSTFIDIGANIGTHSLYALKNDFQRAICIEADAGNFKLLRINQILNEVDDRCINFLIAVSNEQGTAKLELSPTNFGDHRIVLGDHPSRNDFGENERLIREVEKTSLDDLLGGLSMKAADIGLAWVDTQGHEGHVLAGASDLLESDVPIVVEFWPYGLERINGYEKLRAAISRSNRRIVDVRRGSEISRNFLSADQLDAMYSAYLRQDAGAHTDILLL